MKLILADSNELIRIGLRSVLSKEINLEIVGEATNSEELENIISSFGCDLLLIDYTAEGFSIDTIVKTIHKNPKLNIVAITPPQNAQTLVNALRAGVQSYVKKDCNIQEIIDAVRESAVGNKFFCGTILETIQRANINIEDLDTGGFTCEPVLLSDREIQIIKCIAEGQTNIQIAETFFLSNHTVNTHRKNIMSKLGVKNTAGVVMYAVKMNLVSPNKFLFAQQA